MFFTEANCETMRNAIAEVIDNYDPEIENVGVFHSSTKQKSSDYFLESCDSVFHGSWSGVMMRASSLLIRTLLATK